MTSCWRSSRASTHMHTARNATPRSVSSITTSSCQKYLRRISPACVTATAPTTPRTRPRSTRYAPMSRQWIAGIWTIWKPSRRTICPSPCRSSSPTATSMSRQEMLTHVIIHGGYHRGEIGRLLSQISIAPPWDTFAVHLHQTEPSRRLQAVIEPLSV
ncbi:DinB family protein [Mesorhizobium amorphae]|uniref:DinB family protein n=2 Tax=Mesorhizobium amorphae TaxID=71433 RepID=UPI0031380C5C